MLCYAMLVTSLQLKDFDFSDSKRKQQVDDKNPIDIISEEDEHPQFSVEDSNAVKRISESKQKTKSLESAVVGHASASSMKQESSQILFIESTPKKDRNN